MRYRSGGGTIVQKGREKEQDDQRGETACSKVPKRDKIKKGRCNNRVDVMEMLVSMYCNCTVLCSSMQVPFKKCIPSVKGFARRV